MSALPVCAAIPLPVGANDATAGGGAVIASAVAALDGNPAAVGVTATTVHTALDDLTVFVPDRVRPATGHVTFLCHSA